MLTTEKKFFNEYHTEKLSRKLFDEYHTKCANKMCCLFLIIFLICHCMTGTIVTDGLAQKVRS